MKRNPYNSRKLNIAVEELKKKVRKFYLEIQERNAEIAVLENKLERIGHCFDVETIHGIARGEK